MSDLPIDTVDDIITGNIDLSNTNPPPSIEVNDKKNKKLEMKEINPYTYPKNQENEAKKPQLVIPSYGESSLISNPLDTSSAKALDTDNRENQGQGQIHRISSEDYEKNRSYSSEMENTLNEPILETIKRDFKLVFMKMKYVLNPFIKDEDRAKQVKQWDLWGPLIFTLFLSISLFFNKGLNERLFTLVFFIFWVGGFLVYLNANLMGSNASLFQILCLLGYSIFPLNILSVMLCFNGIFEIIRATLAILACFWSCFSIRGFLGGSISEDKNLMVLYPAILVMVFLTGIVYMN